MPRKRSKRELNHITDGQELSDRALRLQWRSFRAWELVLQTELQHMAVTTETARRGAYSTLLALFPGQQGDQTHLMTGVACNSKSSSCSSMYRIRILIHAFSSMCHVRMCSCMLTWLEAKGCPVMTHGSHNKH